MKAHASCDPIIIALQFVPNDMFISGPRYSKKISPVVETNFPSSLTSEGSDSAQLRGKRVAVVVFSHYPSDPRPRREAEALAKLGMKVEVISFRKDKKEQRQEVFNGVKVLRVPLRHWRGGKFSYFLEYGSFCLAAFLLLAAFSLTRRYSLVHVHNMPDVLVFTALLPKLLGAKVILDLHDPMPELMMTIYGLKEQSFWVALLKSLEKWSTSFADLVLTPNVAFLKLFTERSCPVGKLRVVMNSPDENIFKYQEAKQISTGHCPAKPFVIMYHGSVVERHGLDIGVSALGIIKRTVPDAELRIYGQSTPFLEQVLNSVRNSDLQNSVRYLGPRTLDQIVEAIDECNVGIIPNRHSVFTEKNMPTRIFEYLVRAKPVIVPRTTGIQDYFSPEGIIFFEPDNVNDLAEKIQYVFSQPLEVNEIVRRGQAVYRAHRWSEECPKFIKEVCRLLRSRRGPGANDRVHSSIGEARIFERPVRIVI